MSKKMKTLRIIFAHLFVLSLFATPTIQASPDGPGISSPPSTCGCNTKRLYVNDVFVATKSYRNSKGRTVRITKKFKVKRLRDMQIGLIELDRNNRAVEVYRSGDYIKRGLEFAMEYSNGYELSPGSDGRLAYSMKVKLKPILTFCSPWTISVY